MKSTTGATLAALYALAFAAAYVIYLQHAGQFLADAPIMFVALPYTVTFLQVFGSVDLSGDNLRQVFAATLFCAALAYVVGAVVELIVRAAYGVLRPR